MIHGHPRFRSSSFLSDGEAHATNDRCQSKKENSNVDPEAHANIFTARSDSGIVRMVDCAQIVPTFFESTDLSGSITSNFQ
jgi:hypothetical protein